MTDTEKPLFTEYTESVKDDMLTLHKNFNELLGITKTTQKELNILINLVLDHANESGDLVLRRKIGKFITSIEV